MTALDVGSIFAGYRIEGICGQGGMGLVYRATQVELERPVALKLIMPEFADDSEFRQRFKRESLLAASIDHPNVIPVYEAREANGLLFIAMRFVRGTDLRSLMKQEGPLDLHRAVRVLEQVAAALDAAHAEGLVHRDVKPANILITDRTEHVYLTDFGVSKRLTATTGATRTGQLVGTLDYIAPEQIEGLGADRRSDVYALGCVLFHMLAGEPPFAHDTEAALLYAHLSNEPRRVSELATGVPPQLDDVIARAMAKNPNDRFDSAGEFARAAAGLPSETAPARAGSPTRRAAPPAPPTVAAPPPRGGPASGRRWPRGVVAAVAAASLVIAAGALALTGGSGGGDDGDGGGGRGEPRVAPPPAVLATIAVPPGPAGLSASGGLVWVTHPTTGEITRISQASNRVFNASLTLTGKASKVDSRDREAWVTSTRSGTLSRIESPVNPKRKPAITRQVDVGDAPEGVAVTPSSVWVAVREDNVVTRVTRRSSSGQTRIQVGSGPVSLFPGRSGLWVTNYRAGSLTRVSPDRPREAPTMDVGAQPRGVVEAYGSVWVANSRDGTVSQIDPRTRRRKRRDVPVGRNPRELAAGEGFIWVTLSDQRAIRRIDPRTGMPAGGPTRVGKDPLGIAVGGGSVWVANRGSASVTRLRPQ